MGGRWYNAWSWAAALGRQVGGAATLASPAAHNEKITVSNISEGATKQSTVMLCRAPLAACSGTTRCAPHGAAARTANAAACFLLAASLYELEDTATQGSTVLQRRPGRWPRGQCGSRATKGALRLLLCCAWRAHKSTNRIAKKR